MRIALTGAHGTGKTWMLDAVTARLESLDLDIGRIESPTRYIKSLGYKNNEEGQWELQLLSATERVVRQRRLTHLGVPPQLILADRCLNDELAYNDVQFATVTGDHRSFLLWADKLMEQFWLDDVKNYWDVVFYKPIHPDHLPVEDGDRSGAVEFQQKVDRAMLGRLQELHVPYVTLPIDREEAAIVVEQRIRDEFAS